MVSRREWIGMTLGAGAGVALTGCRNSSQGIDIAPRPVAGAGGTAVAGATRRTASGLMMRAIPSSGEFVPVVGLGTSATFSTVARTEDVTALKEVMQTMIDRGATVFDTAPSYGASEEVGGRIAKELGLSNKVFWATKVNVAGGRGGGAAADPARARAQIEASFTKFGVPKIDLIQVHNLGDVPTQYGILKELKKEGRVRYIGITTTNPGQYPAIMTLMRNEQLDFIGVDYALDDRESEPVLNVAQERKVAVLIYAPFGRRRFFARVGDRPLPEWTKEFDATTWAQVCIKFCLSHPAVTCVTPATSQARHMIDNIGGGSGRVMTEAHRQQLIAFVDALPPAPGRGGF